LRRMIPLALLAVGVAAGGATAAESDEAPDAEIALRLEYGSTLAMAGDLDGAESVLSTLLQPGPGEAEACCNLGNVCLLRGDAAAARTLYDRSLGLRPDDAGVLMNRAVAGMLLGDVAGSRRDAGLAAAAAGGRDAALDLVGVAPEDRTGLGDQTDGAVTLTEEDVRALLEAAVSSVPGGADDDAAREPESSSGENASPALRPGAARAAGDSDLAQMLHWKP